MKAYEKVGWLDHIKDVDTGEVIQEGTPLSQRTLGHMDDGIFDVTAEALAQAGRISSAEQEIKVLKDATLNNMVNNVFLKNFDNVSSVAITCGIYDPVAKKIYV